MAPKAGESAGDLAGADGIVTIYQAFELTAVLRLARVRLYRPRRAPCIAARLGRVTPVFKRFPSICRALARSDRLAGELGLIGTMSLLT